MIFILTYFHSLKSDFKKKETCIHHFSDLNDSKNILNLILEEYILTLKLISSIANY